MYKIEVGYSCDSMGNLRAILRCVESDRGFDAKIFKIERKSGYGHYKVESVSEITVRGENEKNAQESVEFAVNEIRKEVERRRQNKKSCKTDRTYII